MIGGCGESRRVVGMGSPECRMSAARFYEGATVVLDLGFRNDNNETCEAKGFSKMVLEARGGRSR